MAVAQRELCFDSDERIECYACRQMKAPSEYQPSRLRQYRTEGTRQACRSCTNAMNQSWYRKNKDTRKISIMAYRAKNPERWQQYLRDHSIRNRDKKAIRKRAYHRSIDGYAEYLFTSIHSRLKHGPSYADRKVTFAREEFLEWLVEKSHYISFHEMWEATGFKQRYAPTIDRIDEGGDYTIENIQVLPNIANIRKYRKTDEAMEISLKNLARVRK